jgi:hypothetical protein
MDCQHLDDLYELFLLGTLPTEAADELRNHLEGGCPSCLERIREAAQTVYLLCLRSKSARLHPQRKSQLLHRLHKRC